MTKKTKLSLTALTLPFIGVVVYTTCSFSTYRKVNKPYIIFATSSVGHRYDFYFRTDSSLKIIAYSLLNQEQTFQAYHMKRDTIMLDTILPETGITEKKYVLNFSADSVYQLLTPVNEKGQKIDSQSLHIEEKNYR